MKCRILIALVMMLISPGRVFAEDLKGEVLLIGEHGEKTPAIGIDITIKETGDSGKTKAAGLFRIFLNEQLKAKGSVMLSVDKPGWVIHAPLNGETPIPTNLDVLVHVHLLPNSSPKLWTDDRLEQLLGNKLGTVNEQVRPGGKPKATDTDRYFEEYAAKHGFSAQQVKNAVDKWVAEVKRKKNPDPYQLGLAASTEKNFGKAGKLFERLAEEKLRHAREESEMARRSTEEAIRAFRSAGDAHMSDYHFDLALINYQKARDQVIREDQPRQWADLTVLVGRAEHEIGTRTEGTSIYHHLDNSIEAYRAALSVYTKEALSEDWAKTNERLCKVLFDQARRTSGERMTGLLNETVEACNDALTIYTKEKFPLQWAFTKAHLVKVRLAQYDHIKGEKGQPFLNEAIAIQQEVRPFLANERTPQLLVDWLQHEQKNSIGQDQLGGDRGRRLVAEAFAVQLTKPDEHEQINAWQKALTFYTEKKFPKEWAGIQLMMGNILEGQAENDYTEEGGTQYFNRAVAAYQKALTVLSAENLPQLFASVQSMIGITLHNQGTRKEGTAGTLLFAQAVSAYQSALKIKPADLPPQPRAAVQALLGDALMDQGTRITGDAGTRLLTEATKSYKAALQVYTPMHFPKGWTEIQQKLAKAYLALENWQGVAESNSNVLTVDPDDKKAYDSASEAYHDKLFAYDSAFDLAKQWLTSHPDDISAQADFAVTHLTTGRYDDAEQRWAELLKRSDLSPKQTIAIRFLAIITLSALRRDSDIPQSLQNLRQIVSSQPDEFHLVSMPAGIIQYVKTTQVFAPHRAWLIELLSLAEAKDRNSFLAVLDSAESHFMLIETP